MAGRECRALRMVSTLLVTNFEVSYIWRLWFAGTMANLHSFMVDGYRIQLNDYDGNSVGDERVQRKCTLG
jgi:FtsP/CotA-like multicopper oxidase with cupredoxin domain